MAKKNPFDGDSYYSQFYKIAYKWITSRQWVTTADVMAEYMMLGSAKDLVCPVSCCEHYVEFKKAYGDVRKDIIAKEGKDSFEISGNNRDMRIRYKGKDEDPLSELRNAKIIDDLRKYWTFCQDSAGFIPQPWLEYYLKDCKDLWEIKSKRQKGERVISASIDNIVKNIEYLPLVYDAIKSRLVLEIDYTPKYSVEINTLTFHPHYLKEYNGRWHLYGHAEGYLPDFGYDIALDRISSRPREKNNATYITAPFHFYEDFFKDIVGVTHQLGKTAVDIVLRAHTSYIYNLMDTKPLHHSQKVHLPYGMHKDGEYGDFIMHLEVNREFVGRVLQMGAGLEIVSPTEVRMEFAQKAQEIANLYHDVIGSSSFGTNKPED